MASFLFAPFVTADGEIPMPNSSTISVELVVEASRWPNAFQESENNEAWPDSHVIEE